MSEFTITSSQSMEYAISSSDVTEFMIASHHSISLTNALYPRDELYPEIDLYPYNGLIIKITTGEE